LLIPLLSAEVAVEAEMEVVMPPLLRPLRLLKRKRHLLPWIW
jgi:hypothetical protein